MNKALKPQKATKSDTMKVDPKYTRYVVPTIINPEPVITAKPDPVTVETPQVPVVVVPSPDTHHSA